VKSIKKLKLARESIRLLSSHELRGTPIAGGASAQQSCERGCEPSGIIACRPSFIHEECV
jgi:natural product precursor